MSKKQAYKKTVDKHVITWSEREQRYIIKSKNKRIYDTSTESEAIRWIKDNRK